MPCYYYGRNTKNPIIKYKEFLPKNFEYLKNTKIMVYEQNNKSNFIKILNKKKRKL